MTGQPAIPAATLVVLSDRTDGAPPDLLIVERASGMAFAAGALVFPGGRVDPADRALAAALGQPDQAEAITAIRETLEETGIACGFAAPPDAAMARALQDALHDGADFADLLAAHRLTLTLSALTPFARWKPAFHQARRFDTLFLLAAAPPDAPTPYPQRGECAAAEWASASAVLARIGRGEAGAIFPTLRNLERLAGFASIDAARADAAAHPVTTITPWIAEIDGEKRICIPEGIGYPVTSEPLSSASRA